MSEKFNDVPPLELQEAPFAAIEASNAVPAQFRGQLWIDAGWLSVAEARELRDWLNEAIPT